MNKHQPKQQTEQAKTSASPIQINSRTLFGNAQQLSILHEGETYTLRITSRGKLILTK